MITEPEIPFARIAMFVRQHTHDVRNGLNSLDLEASLLRELVTDDEGRETVERMHKQLREMAEGMRSLASHFQEPKPSASPISARDLFLIWREQGASLPRLAEVEWVDELSDEMVNVDVEMMAVAFRELLANTAHFSRGGKATASARRDGTGVVFELREPKSEPPNTERWGEAFSTTRRGGYGLGLWSARRIIEANGAVFMQRSAPDGSGLVSHITLPIF